MISKTVREKFFIDPDWKEVEKTLMEFINPLIEMDDVDEKQPAEHVKAEIIGRKKLYKQVCLFLESTGIVTDTKHYKTTFK
jgi:hypothetical protein